MLIGLGEDMTYIDFVFTRSMVKGHLFYVKMESAHYLDNYLSTCIELPYFKC